MPAHSYISKSTDPNFTSFGTHYLWPWHGPHLMKVQYFMQFCFLDDVIFWQWCQRGRIEDVVSHISLSSPGGSAGVAWSECLVTRFICTELYTFRMARYLSTTLLSHVPLTVSNKSNKAADQLGLSMSRCPFLLTRWWRWLKYNNKTPLTTGTWRRNAINLQKAISLSYQNFEKYSWIQLIHWRKRYTNISKTRMW